MIESSNLILPQINTQMKSPVEITPAAGHAISLYKIPPNIYNLTLISSSLLNALFLCWKHNKVIQECTSR